ncbi:MAG: FtsX-like permease family protein [bacterium]
MRVYEFSVALRYLKAKRYQVFVSVISLISILGVAVGVGVLIFVISMMNGFRQEFYVRTTINIFSHIRIMREGDGEIDYNEVSERIEGIEGVVASSPVIVREGMIKVEGYGRALPIVVMGIDFEKQERVSDLRGILRSGDWNIQGDLPGAILGQTLGARLGVIPGDEVVLASLFNPIITPFGIINIPMRFRFGGLVGTGKVDCDESLVYIPLESAEKLFGMRGPNWVQVRAKEVGRSREVADRIGRALGSDYIVLSWEDMDKALYQAMRLERAVMFIILMLTVVVAAFGIASSLVMMVMERTRDIGILKSMGATNGSIRLIFTLEGGIVGLVGAVLGFLGGLGAIGLVSRLRFSNLPFAFNRIPFHIQTFDVVLAFWGAVFICFVASVYPAWQASALSPVEALRYE